MRNDNIRKIPLNVRYKGKYLKIYVKAETENKAWLIASLKSIPHNIIVENNE